MKGVLRLDLLSRIVSVAVFHTKNTSTTFTRRASNKSSFLNKMHKMLTSTVSKHRIQHKRCQRWEAPSVTSPKPKVRSATTADSLPAAAGDAARLVKPAGVGWSGRSGHVKCNVVVTATPNREDLSFQAFKLSSTRKSYALNVFTYAY